MCSENIREWLHETMKSFQLKQQLENSHTQFKDKDRAFFKLEEANLKRAIFDATETFQIQTAAIVKASYEVAYEKNKKGHTIGVTLVKPCLLTCAKLVLGDYI